MLKNKTNKIKFYINTIQEEEEVFNIIKKNIEFIKKHKIKITWPQKSIRDEYNKKDMLKFKNKLEEHWQKEYAYFFEKLQDLFSLKITKPFKIYISNYGSGGSYDLPDNVAINKNLKYDHISIIKHEIVHLILEPFIQKYKIPHNNKEELVDNILKLLK